MLVMLVPENSRLRRALLTKLFHREGVVMGCEGQGNREEAVCCWCHPPFTSSFAGHL